MHLSPPEHCLVTEPTPVPVLCAFDVLLGESGGCMTDVLGNEIDLIRAMDRGEHTSGVLASESASINYMLRAIKAPFEAERLVLSPRNAEKAAALAAEFPSLVSVAATNQAVVDAADVVFVGTLPAATEEVLRALKFRASQTVVSLVSTAPLATLQECAAPCETVVRAIPLPPVARHVGATIMTPANAGVAEIFDALGTAVVVDSEPLMKKMMCVTGLMGQFYAQQRQTQAFLVAQGVGTFDELVHEQTPGGINEQVVRELTEAGAYRALDDTLDGILARIEGRPRPEKRKRPYESEAMD